MNASFDPYHKWLGIPPEEQPPHDYRLLGLRAFESDPDVIANAADRQTLLLRTLQAGKYQVECQRLLNEVSAARVRLLDPQKRQAYDEHLRSELAEGAAPPRWQGPAPLPVAQALSDAEFAAASGAPGLDVAGTLPGAHPPVREPSPGEMFGSPSVRLRRKKSWAPALFFVAVAGLSLVAAAAYYGFFTSAPERESPDSLAGAAAPLEAEEDARSQPGQPREARENPQADTSSSTSSEKENASPGAEPVAPASNTRAVANEAVEPALPSASNESSSTPLPDVPPATATKAPQGNAPPDDNALEAARRQVREIFPKEFEQAQTPEQRVELARFLMSHAQQVKDDPLARYALLYESIEQSIEAGYYPTAEEAVDALSPDWEIDRLRILGRALVAAARSPHAAAMRDQLAVAALALVDEALDARRYDGADQIAGIADGLASRARDADLRRKTRATVNRTTRLKRDWEKVLAAQKTLESDPENAEANLLVGKYLCLESGDLAEGLTHLAKGNRADLKSLAQRDLDEQKQQPADQRAEEKVALADDWSTLAELDEELAGFYVRAYYWYEQAAPIATGLLKTKAERRRNELAANVEVQRLRAGGMSTTSPHGGGPRDVQLTPRDTLLGHTDLVTRVAFSPKGTLLATASNDNTAKIWDCEKQKLLFTLPHKHNVQALAWSPDGKLLATGSRDKTIQIWEAAKGRLVRAIAAHPGPQGVTDVAFAPGGALLVSCGADEPAVRLWNLKTAAPAGELRGPYRRAHAVQATPDGLVVIGGEEEDTATLWNSAGEVVHTFTNTSPVQCVAVSPDGKQLATSGMASRVRIWRLGDGGMTATLDSAFGGCATWSPDGALLAVCGNDAFVQIYDTYDWRQRQRGTSSSGRVGWVSFSADGKLLAGCGGDAVVRLWDVAVSPRKSDAAPAADALASSAAPSTPAATATTPPAPNTPAPGPAAPVGAAVQRVQLLASLRPHATQDATVPPVTSAALSPDGLWLATGGADRAVQLLDISKGALARSYTSHSGPVTAVALDPQHAVFASADDQGQVRLVSFPEFGDPRVIRFESPVERMTFVPGRSLIIGGRDGKLQEWSTQPAAKTFDFQGHSDAISGLAVTPDGATLISTGRDGKLIAWRLADRAAPAQVLRTEPLPIDDLAISPQGDSAAMVVSRAGRVTVFNLNTRRSINIQSAGGQITAAVFLPDGRTMALGVSSGEIHLVDPEQGQRPLVKAHAGAAVQRLLLSSDGSRLASISAAGEVKVWQLLPAE